MRHLWVMCLLNCSTGMQSQVYVMQLLAPNFQDLERWRTSVIDAFKWLGGILTPFVGMTSVALDWLHVCCLTEFYADS